MTQVVIDYRPGLPNTVPAPGDGFAGFGPTDVTSQFITLHDLNFTAVPEPSSFILLGLIAGYTMLYQKRGQLLGMFATA